VVGCVLKRPLARLPMAAQYTAGSLLGALAGLYGCALLALTGFGTHALAGQRLHRRPAGRPAGGQPGPAGARPHPGGHHGAWPNCSRASGRTFCSTRSTAPSPWCAPSRRAPRTLLEDLSDLFRAALIDQGETASLDEEVELARRYLAIEQVRFGERLRVHWESTPRPVRRGCRRCCCSRWSRTRSSTAWSPAPKAQNCGANPQSGTRVRLDIINTLPQEAHSQTAQTAGHGIALANVSDRLRLLHDVEIEFSAGVRDDRYHVRITFPT
jgi:two-component system sensor histidine kinase AlgZ